MANGLFNLKQVIQAVQQGGWSAQKTPAVEYLVVAGGGGAGCGTGSSSNGGGGGGAGGLLQGIGPVPNGQTLLVTVGGGGAGGASNSNGVNGSNSVFGAITSLGGGFGTASRGGNAGSGGSGGGSGELNTSSGGFAGKGTQGQGNAGGTGLSYPCGGGGGAGAVGSASATGSTTAPGGRGGSGATSVISGTATTYAGGGGGCSYNGGGSTAGTGGVGGGGNANVSGSGTSGTANTGGGGGGSGNSGSSGGSGGSGIVIVSYPDVYAAPTATTGSPTVSTSGSGSVVFADGVYVSYPSSTVFDFSSGNFTVECWVYITAAPTDRYDVFRKWVAAPNKQYIFYINSSRQLGMYYSTTGSDETANNFTSATITTNTWTHIAWVRNSTTVTAYINGASAGTLSLSSTFPTTTAAELVGGNGSPGYSVTGYMSNLRVVKGTAVYTGAFTPPTAPLSAISGTSLLMSTMSGSFTTDSSSNSNTPTGYNSGTITSSYPTWNSASPFTGTGYKNRVYTWTSSGSITF